MFLYKIFKITLVLSLITLPNYGLYVHKLGERKLDEHELGERKLNEHELDGRKLEEHKLEKRQDPELSIGENFM
ncbi:24486_t:CDS:2 [Dentiscutata erythropus]|uniref:24486_t:CDS:1 n=1 Tax=Dentiscutata erythropus TaxID=1348616 RepID=A0A9N9BZ36_9GLOM|nr:24486_t:CDS:2 [Dentiscutata erythropus]